MPRPIHSVIHLDELVRRICDYLTELTNDDVEIPLQRDLAALARVSKAFRDVCLDFLWRSLPSPAPLVKLLPAIQELDGELVICGAISDWSTFDTYAKRVRSITIDPSLVVSKTFNELQHNRSTPLLPALKHIIILKTANSWLGGPVLPLVQPTLESLQIDDVYKDNILIPFLWSVHQKAPSIKQLSLASIAKFPVALQFQQLKSLCITQPATLVQIWTLAGLNIESLSIILEGAKPPQKSLAPGFKELTSLTLSGRHSLITEFLFHILSRTYIRTIRKPDPEIVLSHGLQRLTVSPANARSAEDRVKFDLLEALDRIFPQVVLVSTDPVWKEAGILLTFFQKARGAERIRVSRHRA
ncbi:hypothetical protein H0H92_011421 [Tricholoma furcatifolium]|nr:hypothetical protein H0H92_011421 [Tricholoma furcatifolium]